MFSFKTEVIILLIGISIIGLFFGLWRMTSVKLDNARNQIDEMTYAIDNLNKENANLVEYNKRRDKEIKDIEKLYQDQLNSIPADLCGDMKPSEEMIEFFKKGE